jgi:hypothetical protein
MNKSGNWMMFISIGFMILVFLVLFYATIVK